MLAAIRPVLRVAQTAASTPSVSRAFSVSHACAAAPKATARARAAALRARSGPLRVVASPASAAATESSPDATIAATSAATTTEAEPFVVVEATDAATPASPAVEPMVSAAGLGDATPSATGPAVSANNLNSNNNNNNKSDAPTWAEYLAYRKAARTRNRIFTFVGSPAAFVTSSLYVAATYQFDPTVPIFGIEAAMVVGAGALSLGAVAATATPLTLDALWRAATSKTIQRMEPKEKELFRRVLRHRADASLAGPGLALFDYYGTSITSFAAYRNWLRKQRKIKEKGTFGEVASIDL